MPTIALTWEPGAEVPRNPDEFIDVERRISDMFQRSNSRIELKKNHSNRKWNQNNNPTRKMHREHANR